MLIQAKLFYVFLGFPKPETHPCSQVDFLCAAPALYLVARLVEKIGERFGPEAALTDAREKQALLKDGQYIGESVDWPAMKVEVTIQDGRIGRIQVLGDTGTPEFSSRVVETLPEKMVAEGRVDVDGISGATLSSNSLKIAVKAALQKAGR